MAQQAKLQRVWSKNYTFALLWEDEQKSQNRKHGELLKSLVFKGDAANREKTVLSFIAFKLALGGVVPEEYLGDILDRGPPKTIEEVCTVYGYVQPDHTPTGETAPAAVQAEVGKPARRRRG
jgi:hypothetical protein